jgi:hypothetical protein
MPEWVDHWREIQKHNPEEISKAINIFWRKFKYDRDETTIVPRWVEVRGISLNEFIRGRAEGIMKLENGVVLVKATELEKCQRISDTGPMKIKPSSIT